MTSIAPSSIVPPPAPPAWIPHAPSRAAAVPTLTPADLMRVIRQRFFMMLFVALFGIAVTIGIAAFVQKYYPLYTAERIVQITSLQPPDPNNPMDPRGRDVPQDYDRVMLDQSVLALSSEVVQRTLRDPEVLKLEWYRAANQRFQSDASRPVEDALRQTISVTPVRRSSLLRVLASTKVPGDARALVMAVVDKYIAYADEVSQLSVKEEQVALQNRKQSLTTEIAGLNQAMNKHLADYPYIRAVLQGQMNPIDEDVLMNNRYKGEWFVQSMALKAEWETMEQIGRGGLPIPDDILAAVENDPLIVDTRRSLSELERTRFTLASRGTGPQHPQVKTLDASIADMKERLEQTRNDARVMLTGQLREEAQKRYAISMQQLTSIDDQLQDALARQKDQEQQVKVYRERANEFEIKGKDLEEVSRNLSMIDAMAQRDRRVKITSPPAELPRRRSRPDWLVYLGVGTTASLALAFGLALLLELTDTSVRTARDLLRHANLSVLGAIPNADDDEVAIERIETATLAAPHSIIAEAFRQVRTNLFFAAPAEQQGTILISSASPGEGKTTVAINLACAMAMSGRRILLVDANFRRPSLRSFFPELKSEGLSNVLVGQSHATDLICPSGVAGLDVMSAGPIPPNPAELLGGGYIRNMIAEVRGRYDQIIFDGPPLLLVSDALVLASVIDGVVLVCRFRQTSRGAVQRARGLLEGINSRILGAVLNAVEITRGGYFRQQYRAFYEYQADNEPATAGALPNGSTNGPQKLDGEHRT